MMNKLTIDVLPTWWGCIKNKNYRKLTYIMLPLLYILVILGVSSQIAQNKLTIDTLAIKSMDTYAEINISNEDKREIILQKYQLTSDEFDVLCAIVLAEAEYNSYEDAYAVINTIYNRTKSNRWIKSVNNKFGNNKGENLYYQAIAPRQFTVYEHGSYKKYLGDRKSIGYQAIIDFLYTEELLHNYLSFRSHYIKVDGSETFSSKGNNYFNEI